MVVLPKQTALSVPRLTDGSWFMDTITVSVPVQPFALVPITLYDVVELGLAITIAWLLAFRPTDGLHW